MADSSSSGGAGREAPSKAAGILEEIVRLLPLGVAIRHADGASLYVNEAAKAHGADRWQERAPPMGLAKDDEADHESVREGHRGDAARIHWENDRRAIEMTRRTIVVGGAHYDVATSADVTERLRLEEELYRRAYFDDLTGLPNRGMLENGVGELVQGGAGETPFALAFIDIDNFKHINDYYGHSVGDDLLVRIARRIAQETRASDLLARVGGDEFVLLVSPIVAIDELKASIEHICERLKAPFFIGGHEIFTSASIGVSIYPTHGRDHQALRAKADAAMYRMKGAAKGGVNFFEPGLGDKADERAKIEQRLRLAIRDRRLCCAFQPKVDFRSDAVVGVEVLLRWRDEEGVIRPPGDFVNLAVEMGLMDDITRLVLAQTVDAIETIDEAFGADATISINVAAKQAANVRFMRSLAEALADTGYPQRFMVELTEEAFLHKSQFQTRILPMLREVGAKISIDDFGVGYSSLAALADITADEIKIDRSFITKIHQRPRSQTVLRAIESLGAGLGMSIIVEGVETFEELAYLEAATRIRLAQGFYFARPMSFDEFPLNRDTRPDLRQKVLAREVVASRTAPSRSARRSDRRAP
jgi:diguanylate cyclase (GGDEF)-like protein